MNRAPLQDVLAVTKAISDTQRIRILHMLGAGELCVCQIVGVLKLAASTTSKHLSVLAAAGLVESRKEGRWTYYRRATRVGPLRWLQRSLRGDPMLRADARALAKIKQQDLEVLCRQQRPN